MMVVYVFSAAPHLSQAPLGRDGWREADVLMVARNFCRGSSPWWRPLIDSQGETPRQVGMELPALSYAGGRLAASTGLGVASATRVLVMLSTLLAAGCLAALVRRGYADWDSGEQRGALGAVLFFSSPLVIRYGFSAQPDMPALALGLLSLSLLQRACCLASLRYVPLLISAAVMALAVGCKLPMVVFGLPACALVFKRFGWREAAGMPMLWLYALLSLVPPILWYRHAYLLQEISGSHYFNISRSTAEIVHDLSYLKLYGQLIGRLFDLYGGPLVTVLALTALRWGRRIPGIFYAMTLSVLVYWLLAGQLAVHHVYYGLPWVPALAALAVGSFRKLPSSRWQALALLLTLSWGVWRSRRWMPPKNLPAAYVSAQGQLKNLPGAVQLFSRGDPTLLFLLDRRGWVDDDLRRRNAPLVVVDGRRVHGSEAESLKKYLRQGSYSPRYTHSLLEIWERSELQSAGPVVTP